MNTSTLTTTSEETQEPETPATVAARPLEPPPAENPQPPAPQEAPPNTEFSPKEVRRAVPSPSPLDLEAEVAPEEPEWREEDVFGAVVGYGFSDEEMQQYMREKEWKEELKPRPVPLLPAAEQAKKAEHWKQLLTGDVSLIPNKVRDKILGKDETMSEDEQDYQLYAALNRSWAVDNIGLSRDAVQAEWPTYRARLAKRMNVANTDEDVYLALSEREKEKPLREAGSRVYEIAYAAGIEGAKEYEIEPAISQLTPEQQAQARRLGERAYEEGCGHRENLLPLAQRVLKSLGAFDTRVLAAIPHHVSHAPQLMDVVQELGQLTREQRNVVFHVVRSLAPSSGKDENTFLTAARMLNRSRLNIAANASQALAQMTAGAMQYVSRVQAPEQQKQTRRLAQCIDKYSTIFEELRRLGQDELYPLVPRESSGWAGQFMVDMAAALPDAVLSFSKHPIMSRIRYLHEGGQRIMDIRMRAPESSSALASFAGLLGASLRRAFENQISSIGGNKLAKSITRLLRNRGGGVKRFAMNSGKAANAMLFELARETTAEKIGETAALGAEEWLLHANDVESHLNWRDYGENLIDLSTNMREAAVELPFILLGAGRVALRDFTSPQSLLRHNGAELKRWGIPGDVRQKIVNETDIDKQGEMLRKALSGSSRWGGMDFLRRAALSLRLLNLDSFTEFNDTEFVRDFLQLPSVLEGSKLVEPQKDGKKPQSGVLVVNPIYHPDPEYRQQVSELWHESWRKSRYADGVSYFPMPDWTSGDKDSPVGKRLALYLSEINLAPKNTVPRRMMRDGLYAPFAEGERRALLRDRVQDIHNISHLFALNSYAMDSLAEPPIPIPELKQRAESARKQYLGKVVGALMRIHSGEDAQTVMNDMDRDILHHFRDRIEVAPNRPMWSYGLTEKMPEQLPERQDLNFRHKNFWSICAKDPDLLEVYRICVGTRANLKLLSHLFPLTNDYYTALSRGMSTQAAQYHLLKREFPEHELPATLSAESWQHVEKKKDYEAFCQKNNEMYEKSRQIYGELLQKDTGPDGQELWRAQLPDGNLTRWHSDRQMAINDLMVHTQTYFQPFRADIIAEGMRPRRGTAFRPTESENWYSKKNDFLGFDQVFSYASRDMLRYWHESAHLTQPGLVMNRVRKKFHPSERWVADGVSPVYPEVHFRHGRFDVDHMSVFSPLSYLQARFYVFWARMMESGRVRSDHLRNFLARKMTRFPELGKTMDEMFVLPRGYRLKYKFSRFGENSKVAKLMSAFSTCYVLAHPEVMPMPQSYHTWMRLVPYSQPVDDEKYKPGTEPFARRSVPRGMNDSPLMSWVNRKSAEKIQNMLPVTLDMKQDPVFEEADAEVQSLVRESMGQDPIARMEYSWAHALCGEELFRSLKQHWFNFLRNPAKFWGYLPPDERKRLVRFLVPEVRRGEDVAQGERSFDMELARMSDTARVEKAIGEMSRTLDKYPQLRHFCYSDVDSPYAVAMLLNDETPAMRETDEPVYKPLRLYEGAPLRGGRVSSDGSFVPDKDMPPQVENALRLLSLIRRYPVTRPVCLGGVISWNGKVYGGKKGKHPFRTEAWQVDTNPLEPLLLMREKVSKIEEEEMEDAIVHFPLLYNSVYPNSHDEVFGNVTVYRHPTIPMNISRLMPGEPFALHPRALTPYVVQSRHGSYLYRQKLADTLALQGEAMQPLDSFHPWGNQNREEARINEGRLQAINNNLRMAVHHPFDFNQADTPINVSPRELLMRLAVDSGYLETLKNVMPYQMDYGSALTYNLINALYEYSCHPEMLEAQYAWDDITHRLRENIEDYNLVVKVLRESSRSTQLSAPVTPLFDWHESIEPYVRDAKKRKKAQEKFSKPGINPMSEEDMNYLDLDDDLEADPLDESSLELFSFDFSEDHEDGDQALFPKREKPQISPAPQPEPPKSLWSDLFPGEEANTQPDADDE